jgi:hypothetical protein
MRKTPRKRALPPGSYKQNILAIEATPHTRRLMQATSVFATFAHKRPKSVVPSAPGYGLSKSANDFALLNPKEFGDIFWGG